MILTGETEILGKVWSIGGMILTGKTEVLGEKQLYNIGSR
jgi:hypothetical protein